MATPSTSRPLHSLASLPLAPERLQHALDKIPLDPRPSYQRRSQQFKTGHWARVTPLPLPFPFRVVQTEEGQAVDVEEWLGEREPSEDAQAAAYGAKEIEARKEWRAELLGVSERCIAEVLSELDAGSAPRYVRGETDELDSSGQELLEVISGRKVLTGVTEEGKEYGPWSSRYAGHQFGQWAGQLGDGRAISILETASASGGRQEIQLKGAGRTPFSRSADGLAVLRSGVREYLCAEAMSALRIPTSRSLALLTHPRDHLSVLREYGPEPSSLLARVAPSFVRIGNFEILNPPEEARNISFLMLGMRGGGAATGPERDLEALRKLGEWVVGPGGLGLGLQKGEKWGKRLVLETARRNAEMVAGWQVYGFCHGVINTDNVSVLGLTIDYGPYAFMDVYDPYHICNHSDGEGRYDYRKQPTMILYALRSLMNSLAELIGYEETHGSSVPAGWAEAVDEGDLQQWKERGMEEWAEVEKTMMGTFRAKYLELYRKRFGLLTQQDADQGKICDGFLNLLDTHAMDFHSAFRNLCFFQPSMLESDQRLQGFLARMASSIVDADKRTAAMDGLRPWLKLYAERIAAERAAWEGQADASSWEDARSAVMCQHNPRFVLRQWLLEETIAKLEKGEGAERRKVLSNVLAMANSPFEPYGGELKPNDADLSEREREERRLCGLGSKEMLGFQCSCSS